MRIIDFLFSKPADPQRCCHHDLLGEMDYSDEDEAWLGHLNGVPISVAYTGRSEPDQSLIQYGISLAQDKDWLRAEVEKSSIRFLLKCPSYRDEVRGLTIDVIRVYEFKGIYKALIDLEGGWDYRAWRIEFTERTCEGIGFDS